MQVKYGLLKISFKLFIKVSNRQYTFIPADAAGIKAAESIHM